MKRLLLIYPHNFLDRNMGTNNRVYSIMKELKNRGYCIDLFACSNFDSPSFSNFEATNTENIVNKLYLYDFNHTTNIQRERLVSSGNISIAAKLKSKFFKLTKTYDEKSKLDNWVTPMMLRQFQSVIVGNDYDYIVVVYTYMADLLSLDNYKGNAKKIYLMEDCLSVAHFYAHNKSGSFGELLDSEIERIKYFDEIVCISNDEKIFFEKLIDKKFHFLPHIIKNNITAHNVNKCSKILFLGHDNLYNIEGIQWFFNDVYPYLTKNLEIIVAGRVSKHVTSEYPNCTKLGYVENLEELYQKVDIVICPLQGGTGMKIKVVEAMSYAIPVVCTSRGVDGLPDKMKSGCIVRDLAEEFADAINMLCVEETYYNELRNGVQRYFQETLEYSVVVKTLRAVFK